MKRASQREGERVFSDIGAGSGFAGVVAVVGLAITMPFGYFAVAQVPAGAQKSAPAPVGSLGPRPPDVPAKPVDADLVVAQAYLEKAVFLRNFYAANDLAYDAAGHVQGAVRATDWTLAAVALQKAERRSPSQIEITGLRVAIRYNEDAHEFQRHNQGDEKIKILLTDPGLPKAFAAALETIFAIGIDPALQRSMPDYWRHYFDPSLAWPADPKDPLNGQTIEPIPGGAPAVTPANQPKAAVAAIVPPRVEHKVEASYSPAAEHDKVHGVMQLRLVVDTEGVPRRIAITRPIGYGLDQRAVEATQKMRFAPATRAGTPVPAALLINQDFIVVQTPARP